MKARELAEELLKHPDFDVEFTFADIRDNQAWPDYRTFEGITIDDIGYSEKVIKLGGNEDD